MANSSKKSGRRTGGFDGKYIVPLLIVAALVMSAALAVSADGDGNLSETKEWECGVMGSPSVKAKLDNETGVMTISGTGLMKDCDSAAAVPWDGVRSSIKSVVVQDGVKSVGDYAFKGCTQLTTVTIGNDVTDIGIDAFNGCAQLASVTLGNNVDMISVSAFNGCDALTSITIPDNVTLIGHETFEDCASLTTVTLGSGLLAIIDYAFNGCDALTSITIPDSVQSIGKHAFKECTSLATIIIGKNIMNIDPDAFSSHVFYDGSTKITDMSKLPGNTFKADGKVGEKIKMVKERPSPTPAPAPTSTPIPIPTSTPDKQMDDPTGAFLAVVFAAVIALIGLAFVIARRK